MGLGGLWIVVVVVLSVVVEDWSVVVLGAECSNLRSSILNIEVLVSLWRFHSSSGLGHGHWAGYNVVIVKHWDVVL